MSAYAIQAPHRLTRAEYDRLIDAGFFLPDDPVELIGGELIVAERKRPPHYVATPKPPMCTIRSRSPTSRWSRDLFGITSMSTPAVRC